MCVRNFSFVVSFVYIINAQIALPTFQAVHKPHDISSSIYLDSSVSSLDEIDSGTSLDLRVCTSANSKLDGLEKDTPDDGNTGIIKNLSIGAYITKFSISIYKLP